MNTPSNESLLQELHDAAAELSYFNAAEGDNWYREQGARSKAQARYTTLVNVAAERGIYNKDDFKGYLV